MDNNWTRSTYAQRRIQLATQQSCQHAVFCYLSPNLMRCD